MQLRIDVSDLHHWREFIPDTPETLEARALALLDETSVYPLEPAGVLLVDGDCRLGCLYGTLTIESFLRRYCENQLACEVVAPAPLATEDWSRSGLEPEPATLWRLGPAGLQQPPEPSDVEVQLLQVLGQYDYRTGIRLDDLLEGAPVLSHGPVSNVSIQGRLLAQAYVPWRTERLADLSVATLEPHRQRGLGAAAVTPVIAALLASGVEPIWGAVTSNHASLALARKLGFTAPAGELLVLSPVNE